MLLQRQEKLACFRDVLFSETTPGLPNAGEYFGDEVGFFSQEFNSTVAGADRLTRSRTRE